MEFPVSEAGPIRAVKHIRCRIWPLRSPTKISLLHGFGDPCAFHVSGLSSLLRHHCSRNTQTTPAISLSLPSVASRGLKDWMTSLHIHRHPLPGVAREGENGHETKTLLALSVCPVNAPLGGGSCRPRGLLKAKNMQWREFLMIFSDGQLSPRSFTIHLSCRTLNVQHSPISLNRNATSRHMFRAI